MSSLLRAVAAISLCLACVGAGRLRAQYEPAPASPFAGEENPRSGEQESAPEPAAEQPSPFDAALGFAAFTRSFEYKDNLSGLRSYGLDLGPSLALRLHWYPGAHFDSGAASLFGLDLRGQTAFAIDSAFGADKYPTSSNALGIGVRARLPIEGHELAAVIGYGHQSFAIDDALSGRRKLDPGVPSTSYSFARLGAELRFVFGDYAASAAAAYLPTFSTGEVGRLFPHASAAGMETEISLSRALSSAFELSFTLGLQRFAYSLKPQLSEVKKGLPIAGGALDQYLWGSLGARFFLGR
jgi:hypothetical protein